MVEVSSVMNKEQLELTCKKMRRDCLVMADAAGNSGLHFGGTLSMIEIVATLYMSVINTGNPLFQSDDRDRVIVSKGHGIPAVYAVLHQMGILSVENLKTFKADETELYGHPSLNARLGIEFSSGSLGQGLSLGVGTALALKLKDNNTSRVYVVLGDGECDEGSVWEAAMSAAKYKLNNLFAIVDQNHMQYDGNTEEVMPIDSLRDKWCSFGWECDVIDGHDVIQCKNAFSEINSKPKVVIAQTIKGKGISFMEGVPSWHHAVMTQSQRKQAWEEIGYD